MIRRITAGRAVGEITVPPSKSEGHRALICAALSENKTELLRFPKNQDMSATVHCLTALGYQITENGDIVTAGGGFCPSPCRPRVLDCFESGSTLRFLLPLALNGIETVFTGTPRLMERPLGVYRDLCRRQGIVWEQTPDSVLVRGKLRPDTFEIPGNISSQFLSGLFFALPLLEKDSIIRLTTPAESLSYVEMTEQMLARFGVTVKRIDGLTWLIPANQRYSARKAVKISADHSAAAFFGALNTLGGSVVPNGLEGTVLQGDAVWQAYFPQLANGCPTLSVKDCPDLAPILMALGGALHGVVLTDTARLRFKESDRGAAMAQELAAFGIPVTVQGNQITVADAAICRPKRILDGHNDHRIVMALAVLCTVTGGEIRDAEAVAKSLPQFWDLLSDLNIHTEIIG